MDAAARTLDAEILKFIAAHRTQPAPEESFAELAFKVFRHQYERNLFYRRLCDAEGNTPGILSSWKDIPAMPAAGFKELVLTSYPKKNAVKVFRTSGTTRDVKGASATGVRHKALADSSAGRIRRSFWRTSADASRGVHFFDTLKLTEAALIPSFEKYMLPDAAGCRLFFLTASPLDAPHSSLSNMMGVVNHKFSNPRGKFYVKGETLLFEALVRDLGGCRRKVMLLSTAFALKAFLDRLAARNMKLKLPEGSRLMETGGFKGRTKEVSKAALYRACAGRLGIKPTHCVSEYGMTELSSQFYDTTLFDIVNKNKRRPFKAGPAWVRTVVVDPVTGREAKHGKPGLLRHYDLANRGSVMAVETEDLGRARGEGFELLGRAPGAVVRGCSLAYETLVGSGA